MLEGLLRPLRRLRSAAARWSSSDDKRFHDHLFANQPHDPFRESFVGYVTIRRFAALAAPYVRDGYTVLDLGCGPGEITCALAALCPGVTFLGVDHSEEAIRRASHNAATLGLGNVSFECADAATFTTDRRVHLIAMFDAFHHVLDPSAFVKRCSQFSDRFFLIEPAGDALGRWRRALDFDWLPAELDKVRYRIEHQLGLREENEGRPAVEPTDPAGRAVEHRYPLSDFEAFFAGFHLEVRGTVAGFDAYPPDPHRDTAWRGRAMNTVLSWIEAVDDELLATGMDLSAKHWALYATKDPSELRVSRRPLRSVQAADDAAARNLSVCGPYDASYSIQAPTAAVGPDATLLITVQVTNSSWRAWVPDQPHPVHLSYHWLRPDRRTVDFEGLRTPLGGALTPGQTRAVTLNVKTPSAPGRYVLEIDLVEEGVTWFSQAGIAPGRITVTVTG